MQLYVICGRNQSVGYPIGKKLILGKRNIYAMIPQISQCRLRYEKPL